MYTIVKKSALGDNTPGNVGFERNGLMQTKNGLYVLRNLIKSVAIIDEGWCWSGMKTLLVLNVPNGSDERTVSLNIKFFGACSIFLLLEVRKI